MTAPEHRGPWDDYARYRAGNTAPGRTAPARRKADEAFFVGKKERVHLPTLAAWLFAIACYLLLLVFIFMQFGGGLGAAIHSIAPTSMDTTNHGSIEATMVWAEGGQ